MKKFKCILMISIIFILLFAFSSVQAVPCETHSFTIFELTTQKATCTKNGKAQYRCANCMAITIKSTPKSSHDYTKFIKTVSNATCTKSGKAQYKCKNCSAKTTKSTGKLAHKYTKFVKTIEHPTCVKSGKAQYKCETCTATTYKLTNKAAHSYTVLIKTIKESTCTKEGIATYKCKTCTKTQNGKKTKLSHDFVAKTYDSKVHIKVCKDCKYEMKNLSHIFKNNKCTICGDTKTKEFKITSTEQVKELQNKLKDLGYYNGAIDGKATSQMLNAINELLRDNDSEKSLNKIADITDNINKIVMNTSKTRRSIIETKLKTNSTILNKNENKKFDDVITLTLSSNITYSQDEDRNSGYIKITEKMKNGDLSIDSEKIAMDCSAFASTVMSVTYGIDCMKEGGGSTYSTYNFSIDKTNFIHTDYSEKDIIVNDLKKGELILCIDDDGEDHIMVYAGNSLIAHTGGKKMAISLDKLSKNNSSTKTFLSTKEGRYDHIYVLTPKK